MDVQHGSGLSPWGTPRGRDEPPRPPKRRPRTLLLFIRYGIPLAVFIAGIVVLVAASDRDVALEAGFMFFGVAIAVLLLNLFFRIGARGDAERDREEEARRYFDRYGRWPDDPPAA